MGVNIILLLAGLVLVVIGADKLVDGASSIARKSGISEFVIGLTIVGFGTSCPELVVSVTGAIAGNSDITIGNVIGSNIFNVLLILGLTALFTPVSLTRENRRKDIPMTLGVTILLILCGMNSTLLGIGDSDTLSRAEGIVFLILFAVYLYYCFKSNKTENEDNADIKEISTVLSVIYVCGGLAALIFGGKLFVDSAVTLAKEIGVSDKFIAVTILAGGTSFPELATSIVAALKKKSQLALGNILGSNIFNILLILGCSSIISPISLDGINIIDVGVLLSSMVLLVFSAYTFDRNKIDRFDAVIMLIAFVSYYFWLILNI